jgi:hypothetical protein
MSRAAHLLGGRASPEKRRIRNDRRLRGDVRSCFASKKAFLLKSMARSKGQGATPQKGIPSVTPEVGFRLLSQQILKGQQLSDSATRDDGLESLSERIVKGEEIQLLSADDFHAWNNTTRNYIYKAFGENHRISKTSTFLKVSQTTCGLAIGGQYITPRHCNIRLQRLMATSRS